jgi:hypothetical protein
LKSKGLFIELDSPLEVPSLVARNYLQKEYYALRLAKTCVVVNGIAHIACRPPPLPTIYLYGPDLMAEKEAIRRSGFFMVFPQEWGSSNGYGWNNERLGLNTSRKSDLLMKYKEYHWLRTMASLIDQLSTEEVIRLAYDIVFGRNEPNGARRVINLEAFSQVAVTTIARNFARARANRLLKNGLKCHPQGSVNIEITENKIQDNGFSENDRMEGRCEKFIISACL